ncbi:MAG: hypothetical protein ACJ71Q_09070 [Terriglobales bacterium]
MSESRLRTSDSNPTRARQQQNVEAFQRVIERLYIPNRFSYPVRSSVAFLDINAEYRRWTFDCVIVAADVEKAVEKALENEQDLLDHFWKWFVLPEVEPGIDPPILTPDERKLHSKIQQRCGAEFRRRGLWPLHRYLRLSDKAQAILDAA